MEQQDLNEVVQKVWKVLKQDCDDSGAWLYVLGVIASNVINDGIEAQNRQAVAEGFTDMLMGTINSEDQASTSLKRLALIFETIENNHGIEFLSQILAKCVLATSARTGILSSEVTDEFVSGTVVAHIKPKSGSRYRN
jgi:uncharacterized protein YejL (UPF0352 family)